MGVDCALDKNDISTGIVFKVEGEVFTIVDYKQIISDKKLPTKELLDKVGNMMSDLRKKYNVTIPDLKWISSIK